MTRRPHDQWELLKFMSDESKEQLCKTAVCPKCGGAVRENMHLFHRTGMYPQEPIEYCKCSKEQQPEPLICDQGNILASDEYPISQAGSGAVSNFAMTAEEAINNLVISFQDAGRFRNEGNIGLLVYETDDYAFHLLTQEIGVLVNQQRQQAIEAFAQKILHGDDGHKAWLLWAAKAYATGQPLPEIVNSDKLERIITLELERGRLREALTKIKFSPEAESTIDAIAEIALLTSSIQTRQTPDTSGVVEVLRAAVGMAANKNRTCWCDPANPTCAYCRTCTLASALSPEFKQMIAGGGKDDTEG